MSAFEDDSGQEAKHGQLSLAKSIQRVQKIVCRPLRQESLVET